MHSITASQLALWKKAIDCRRDVAATSPGGVTTRCKVERQRSLVQRAMASPRLMINESGTTGAAVQRSSTRTSSPPAGEASLVASRVEQSGDRAVVGVGAGAQLAGPRRFAERRVVEHSQRTGVTIDARVEEVVRQIQRLGEQAHQAGDEGSHRGVVRLHRRLKLGERWRPRCRFVDEGLGGITWSHRREVDRAHRERLFEIGRRVGAQRCRQALALQRRVAIRISGVRHRHCHLVGRGEIEELGSRSPRRVDHLLVDTVVGDHQEPGVFARPGYPGHDFCLSSEIDHRDGSVAAHASSIASVRDHRPW